MSHIGLSSSSNHVFNDRLKQSFKQQIAKKKAEPKLSRNDKVLKGFLDDTTLLPFLNAEHSQGPNLLGTKGYRDLFNEKKIRDIFGDDNGNVNHPLAKFRQLAASEKNENGVVPRWMISGGIGVATALTALTVGLSAPHLASKLIGTGITLAVGGASSGVPMITKKKQTALAQELAASIKANNQEHVTDLHHYWQEVSKLRTSQEADTPEMIRSLVNMYKFGDHIIQSQKGHSILDVYIQDDQKSHLSRFKPVGELNAIDITSENQEEHQKLLDILPQDMHDSLKVSALDKFKFNFLGGNDLNNDQLQDGLSYLGSKLYMLKEMGIDASFLKDDTKFVNSGKNNIEKLNLAHETLAKKYKPYLDEAYLLFKAKNSMAAPVFSKIQDMLDNKIAQLSQEAVKREVKDVPKLLQNFSDQYINHITLQFGLQGDQNIARVMNAIKTTSLQRMAGVFNAHAKDAKQVAATHDSWSKATIENPFPASRIYYEQTKEVKKEMHDNIQNYVHKSAQNKITDLARKFDAPSGKVRRWQRIPSWIPGNKRKLKDSDALEKDIKRHLQIYGQ